MLLVVIRVLLSGLGGVLLAVIRVLLSGLGRERVVGPDSSAHPLVEMGRNMHIIFQKQGHFFQPVTPMVTPMVTPTAPIATPIFRYGPHPLSIPPCSTQTLTLPKPRHILPIALHSTFAPLIRLCIAQSGETGNERMRLEGN